jgi:hypothetical protein
VVRGTTNLPEGAVLSIYASQAFRFEREHEIRASRIATSSAVVKRGKFDVSLGPLDYGDLIVGLEPGTGDLEYGAIAVIDNAVTVCTEFQTGEDYNGDPYQQDDVMGAVGSSGEMLKNSPQVEEFGSLTPTPSYWLRALSSVRSGASALLSAVDAAQGSSPQQRRLHGFCV